MDLSPGTRTRPDARVTCGTAAVPINGAIRRLLYYPNPSMTVRGGLVRLQIPSLFDMVDLVQVLSDRMGQLAAFDEDAVHWIGVAVRESVINAIKHGNREHPEKVVSVTDQGEGFQPEEVADPLAPENILKSSGRGIFFMRSFMDDVQLDRP